MGRVNEMKILGWEFFGKKEPDNRTEFDKRVDKVEEDIRNHEQLEVMLNQLLERKPNWFFVRRMSDTLRVQTILAYYCRPRSVHYFGGRLLKVGPPPKGVLASSTVQAAVEAKKKEKPLAWRKILHGPTLKMYVRKWLPLLKEKILQRDIMNRAWTSGISRDAESQKRLKRIIGSTIRWVKCDQKKKGK